MNAPLCRQCGGPCEPERHHYATPVCLACLPAPAPLRVIPTREQLEAEVTRLHAALTEIAALQTEEPTHEDGLHGLGLWQAAEMARAALVSK